MRNISSRLVSLTTVLFVALIMWAADVTTPENLPAYYTTYIDNKSGVNLFTGIHNVSAVGFKSLSYDGVWKAYKTTDTKSDGTTIYDYYSYCSNFTYYSSQDGKAPSNSKEGDCYNREHSIPKSWFGGTTSSGTPGTDLFHLVPADKIVNSLRNNHPYGEVTAANATSKTKQGCGSQENPLDNYNRYGTASSIKIDHTILSSDEVTKAPTVTVFEPLSEYKGDLARGYFGTLIKWAGEKWNSNKEQTFTIGDGAQLFSDGYTAEKLYGLSEYGVALLLKWHREDPVSQREIDRNNGIQETQGNRNPFIDYPILAEYIWGKYSGETFLIDNAVGSFESAFVVGESDGDNKGGTPITKYTITWSVNGETSTAKVEKDTRPSAPSVSDCSATRVFRGWTTSSSFTGEPSPLYKSATIPTASAAATYYAVYADASTIGGDTKNASFSPSDFEGQGTSGTGGAIEATKNGVTFSCDKGYGDTEALRCYKNSVVTISSAYTITDIQFSLKKDYTGGLSTSYTDLDTKEWSTTLESQARFTSIEVTYSEGSTTYSNYGVQCASVVLQDYTVTFMDRGTKYDEVTDKEGTSILIYDPTASCGDYTFFGWSTETYDSDNTEFPDVIVPDEIPSQNTTYYAVYSTDVQTGLELTDEFKKITKTSELTDANYLVVADTSQLLAMSTTIKSSYYLAPVAVTAEEDVISTDGDSIIWYIDVDNTNSSLTLHNSVAGYFDVYQKNSYYNIQLTETATNPHFSYEVKDGAWILSSTSLSTTDKPRQIEFYKKNARWAIFTSQDAPIYLYKQQQEPIYTTYYTTAPDCGGSATEVEEQRVEVNARKVLIDGQLYIIRGTQIYDSTGRRIR